MVPSSADHPQMTTDEFEQLARSAPETVTLEFINGKLAVPGGPVRASTPSPRASRRATSWPRRRRGRPRTARRSGGAGCAGSTVASPSGDLHIRGPGGGRVSSGVSWRGGPSEA